MEWLKNEQIKVDAENLSPEEKGTKNPVSAGETGFLKLVQAAGIEPTSTASETATLSIVLRLQN